MHWRNQDLITDSDWRGAEIFDLLKQQSDLYLPEYPHLIQMRGDNLLLNPNGALYVGLAFHELVVNTVSHNANLADHPPIVLECRRETDIFEVFWKEPVTADPAAEGRGEDARSNFGSVVLEKVVPAALAGEARYTVSATEVSYALRFPAHVAI